MAKSDRKGQWAEWKRAQRKYPTPPGKKNLRRHHDGKGDHVRLISEKEHARIHKRNGTAGGRGRKTTSGGKAIKRR
jgi:hypothetical protein